MQNCPKCQSDRIHASRSRSKWEAFRKEITGKRVFRCQSCGWRGWGFETAPLVGIVQPDAAPVENPPNFKGTPLERTDRPELILDDLDTVK